MAMKTKQAAEKWAASMTPPSSEFGRDIRGEEPRIASGDAGIHISFAE